MKNSHAGLPYSGKGYIPTFGATMKKYIVTIFFIAMLGFVSTEASAQCSICTKTAMQLGARPAQGLNAGILFLAAVPYLSLIVLGYVWWKSKKSQEN